MAARSVSACLDPRASDLHCPFQSTVDGVVGWQQSAPGDRRVIDFVAQSVTEKPTADVKSDVENAMVKEDGDNFVLTFSRSLNTGVSSGNVLLLLPPYALVPCNRHLH